MLLKKYGKSSEGLLNIKKSFFLDNDVHLQKQNMINDIYVQQPARTECKNCARPVQGSDFESHGVKYAICTHCSHLNGMHVETDDFFYKIYHQDGGGNYSANYDEGSRQDYDYRVQKIYLPKAQFLEEALTFVGVKTKGVSICDYGAGSGFFVAALMQKGFSAKGLEVSDVQVQFGNKMLGANALSGFDPKLTIAILSEMKCEVISLIGVLEHLPSPRAALAAIKSNRNIKHIYFSVPMLSPSVFFEVVFTDLYNRQLGGSHTHLYTRESIQYFCKEFNLKLEAQWLFGTDVMDIYRHTQVSLQKAEVSENGIQLFDTMFKPQIDILQLAFDKAEVCSEGHFLISK
jgi:2-polyprenyl-3-methyl-5-hydroxy-6-metoxy-1,4-benzoquinol methylase